MKNENLYNRTINILAKAYRDGTLFHSSCSACAVGNIIKSNLGWVSSTWYKFLVDYDGDEVEYREYYNDYMLSMAIKELASTGYSNNEVRMIEKAFESKQGEYSEQTEQWEDSDGFLGLMAVVDVLDTIHENTCSDITLQSKNKIKEKVVFESVENIHEGF